ncbi:MAG: hypothetical protein HY291_24360 [Planctomycetes bacterium]|nr:hypothetical protein [Planctomycetota bacterium]
MQILYCDSCGYRIPERDVADGRATAVGGKTLCEKCRPAAAAEKPSKSSNATIPLAGKVSVTRESSTSVMPVRFSESSAPARAIPAAKPQANSNATVIGIVMGLAAALLLVAFLFSSSPKSAPGPERSAVQGPTPPIAHPAPETPRPPSQQQPVEKPVAEHAPQPVADPEAEAHAEKEASDAFDAVTRFEGLAEDDYKGRAARMGEFIAKYGGSVVSVRARKMQGELKVRAAGTPAAPAADPAAPPVTAGVAKPAATAVFLKQDTATHGAWKGVYGADGYYLANFLEKNSDLKAKDPKLDILKKPAYLSDLGRFSSHAYRTKAADVSPEAGLQDPADNDRHLAVDIAESALALGYHLDISDNKPHQVALYLATGGMRRAQYIEVLDLATRAVLNKQVCDADKFKAGVYYIWEIAGPVIIRVQKTSDAPPVCSGIFFDPPAATDAHPIQPADPAVVTPAPATAADPAVEAARRAELLAELRKESDAQMKLGRFEEALQLYDAKAKGSRYDEIKEQAAQEHADIAALAAMKKQAFEELKKMTGKPATLTVSGREITGTVKADPKRDDLSLRMSGGAEISFGFDQLEPVDIGALVPLTDGAGRAEDLKRRGLLMLYKGNAAEAKSYFTGARKAGLGDAAEPYFKRVEEVELGESEAGARRTWAKAEAHFQAKDWKEALAAYEEFEKRWAATKSGAEHAAVLKERLRDVDFGLHPLRPGLVGAYFKGKDFAPENLLVTRTDLNVDFDWGLGSPAKEVPVDNFSARWTGVIRIAKAGVYTFATFSDDGSRLSIDGKKVIDQWVDHSPLRFAGTIELQPGAHELVLDFFENGAGAQCHLRWSLKDAITDEVVPAAVLFHDAKAEPATTAVPPKK